jgi:hypothetical protein
MKPYVIWTPQYRNVSGGIRALFLLAHLLRERGFRAEWKMTHPPFVPSPWADNPWGVPECVEFPSDAIHVYPEILEGNPSGSSRVVWWLLNHADRDGLRFVWHPTIGSHPLLNVPYLEADVFRPGDGVRSGVLVWQGKGNHCFVPEGARLITHGWPATRVELAEVLRSAEYLISFDAYTALVHEATLCGCPVVIKQTGIWDAAKTKIGPMRIYGAVDDESKLDEARAEVGLAYQAYLDYMPEMELQLDRFIEMTQAL